MSDNTITLTDDQTLDLRMKRWGVFEMTPDEQQEYLRSQLTNMIIAVFDDQNAIHSVSVPEKLVPVYREFLDNLKYPKGHAVYEDNELSDYLNDQLKIMLTQVQVHGLTNAQLMVENMSSVEHIPDLQFFTRIETFKGIEEKALRAWDNQLGISQTLARQGIFVKTEDIKQAYVFFNIMNLMEQYRSTQIQLAPKGVTLK